MESPFDFYRMPPKKEVPCSVYHQWRPQQIVLCGYQHKLPLLARNRWSGRPLHPLSARSLTELIVFFAMHGTKAGPLAALCELVYLGSPQRGFFVTGTQKSCLLRGRVRCLSSLVAVLLVCLCSAIAQQSQPSAETSATETDEELAQYMRLPSVGVFLSPLQVPLHARSVAQHAFVQLRALPPMKRHAR